MKKEKILINIENLSCIEEYKKIGFTNFLFAVNNLSIGYNAFDINDLKTLNVKKYLLMNKVLNNEDLNELERIKEDLVLFDGIIFEDIGVYNILKDIGINLIWNQTHFATNYSSINYWLELTHSAVISNEITKNEVKEILNNTKKPLILNIFGKNPVMYSRRTLLTNFNKYYKLNTNKEMILYEKISNIKFIAKESDKGTILFNNTYFNIIDYIKEFDDSKILYYLIYPDILQPSDIENIINNKSNIEYNDGFMNKKTIYKIGGKV